MHQNVNISNRIYEEQEKIKQFTERQANISKQNNEIRQINDQLRADIERLEETIYRESQQTEQQNNKNENRFCDILTPLYSTNIALVLANELVEQRVQSLTKALEEIELANEKMRNEKTSLLEEYHNRLNNFENSLQRNAILRDFVENWRCQTKRNKELLIEDQNTSEMMTVYAPNNC
ncbi:hypothetical protein ACTXT7_004630 [Hymenolepis weldensis]